MSNSVTTTATLCNIATYEWAKADRGSNWDRAGSNWDTYEWAKADRGSNWDQLAA